MPNVTRPSRRDFLRQAACSAVGYSAVAGAVLDLYKINAIAQTNDYRALVCVFLFGGNDANNMIVPRSIGYAEYAAARGNLALPSSQLLPVFPENGDGREWGFHPSMTGLQILFEHGKVAIVSNIGPLVAPITQAQYRARSVPVPPSLFSHSDQQALWQTSVSDRNSTTGWGGRTADLLRSLNDNQQVSMSISLGGSNTYQIGRHVFQYQVSPSGSIALNNYRLPPSTDPESRALDRILARQHANIFENAYRDTVKQAIDNDLLIRSAVANAPPLVTTFPTTRLGSQLRMVAQLIASRATIGHRRQIFFCATGGYDTHGNQMGTHAALLQELSEAVSSFYGATVELGVADQVTTFTASDFGRTFPTNGSGSDHGWGSHHLVVGGAVRGRRFYGTFPTLVVNGPDDTGLGRWIPTTSVDEYSATLARWFGVAASDLPIILPNIGRFAMPNLGFLG